LPPGREPDDTHGSNRPSCYEASLPACLVAYGLVLWAQTRAPLAIVAALRETSIVFAAGIGAVAFHERLPGRRLVASAVVAVGPIMLALG
jgi:drug/metabolite transporter (DMT)-like permease